MTSQLGQIPKSDCAPDVQAFISLFGLTDKPELLEYSETSYGQDWCHVSAKHHALIHGGRRVHGWALWQYDGMVMGDFHSVWEGEEGLVDMTPPKFGANQVLFVRDRVSDIYKINGLFVFPTNRSSLPNARFWWDGKPTNDEVWGLPETNTALVAYCKTLGFPTDSLVTEPSIG